jgi:hypothetical protein
VKDTRQNVQLVGDSETTRLGIRRISIEKSACRKRSPLFALILDGLRALFPNLVKEALPTTRPEPLFSLQAVLSRKCFGRISLLRAYIASMRIRLTLALLSLWVLLACDFSRTSGLVLVGAKIYPSPTEPPIDNGSILVHDGRILAVGPSPNFFCRKKPVRTF